MNSHQQNQHLLQRRKTISDVKILDLKSLCIQQPLLQTFPPSWPPQLRVFFSSTFDDFRFERLIFFKDIYEDLNNKCNELGIELIVVDFRTGILDSVTNEHLTMEICLEEVENCLNTSYGINMISLLGERHGYIPLPKYIDKEVFNYFIKESENDNKSINILLKKWYQLDLNHNLPIYTLLNISTVEPEFWDNKDTRSKFWNDMSNILEFFQIKSKNYSKSVYELFHISVTEAEVRSALSINNINCKIGIRKFYNTPIDIPEIFKSDIGSDRLNSLVNTIINETKDISFENFSIDWNDKEGEEYKQKLINWYNKQFNESLSFISESLSTFNCLNQCQKKLADDILRSSIQCKNTLKSYFHRIDIEQEFDKITNNKEIKIILIGGFSGSGKSVITAWLANILKEQQKLVIFRSTRSGLFSSRSLIVSIIQQYLMLIDRECDISLQDISINSLLCYFESIVLESPIEVTIIIDGLDLLDSNLLIIYYLILYISTKGIKLYITVSNIVIEMLQDIVEQEQSSIRVIDLSHKTLSLDEAWNMLIKLSNNRSYTDEQKEILLKALDIPNISPLYVETVKGLYYGLKSYDIIEKNNLPYNIDNSMKLLLDKISIRVGSSMLSRTIGFILASNIGISEKELNSFLKIIKDDILRKEIFKYHPDEETIEGIPLHVISRTIKLLQPIILTTGSENSLLLQFKHLAINRAANLWIHNIDELLLIKCRNVMINYFETLTDTSFRKQTEYPHLLANEKLYDTAVSWLSSPSIFLKYSKGNFYDAILQLPNKERKSVICNLLRRCVERDEIIQAFSFAHQFSYFEEIGNEFEKLKSLEPIIDSIDDLFRQFLIGTIYECMGQYNSAYDCFITLIKNDKIPKQYLFGSFVFLAYLNEYKDDTNAALNCIKNAYGIIDIIDDDSNKKLYKSICYLSEAQIHMKMRNLKPIEELFLKIERNCNGILAGILNSDMAQFFELQGDFVKAKKKYEQCELIYKRLYGNDHPQLGSVYNGWGLACENSNEFERSLQLFELSLNIRRSTLGDDHQDLIPSLSNLIASYMCSDQFDRAMELQEWMQKILDKIQIDNNVSSTASHFSSQSRIARRDIVHLIFEDIIHT